MLFYLKQFTNIGIHVQYADWNRIRSLACKIIFSRIYQNDRKFVDQINCTMEKCVVCDGNAPFKCTACKSVNYCSVEHQKKHWLKHKHMCRPFKIEQSNELGRYLVATRDIPAKSVLFVEPPLVIGPKWCVNDDEKISSLFPCVGCFKPIPINLHRCLKCSWPICEDICSGLSDPNMHAIECLILSLCPGPSQKADLKTLCSFYRSDVLLTFRCLLLQWKYPNRWNKVNQLESHDQQRLGTRYYNEADERIVSFLVDNFWSGIDKIERELGKKVLEHRDKRLLHRICGVMEVNALNIGLHYSDQQEVSALFESACILEHSCIPNCYYTFDTKRNFKITMRAGRSIKKGEHLAIMYTHMLWGTQMRQEHLLTNKYFVCKCERCLDATELGTNISALKCIGDIGKTCGGILLPKNPIDITTDWFCNKCDVSISNEQIDIVLTNIEQEVDDLLMPSVSRIDQSTITPATYEALITKLTNLMHENHYHLFALKHTLIQLYGHNPGYMPTELSDEILQRKIQLCERLLFILDRIDPNTMRLTLYTAIVLYELHSAILEQKRRSKSNGIDKTDEFEILRCAQQYLQHGKDALALNTDITQGRKLLESFDKAEMELIQLFEEQKLSQLKI